MSNSNTSPSISPNPPPTPNPVNQTTPSPISPSSPPPISSPPPLSSPPPSSSPPPPSSSSPPSPPLSSPPSSSSPPLSQPNADPPETTPPNSPPPSTSPPPPPISPPPQQTPPSPPPPLPPNSPPPPQPSPSPPSDSPPSPSPPDTPISPPPPPPSETNPTPPPANSPPDLFPSPPVIRLSPPPPPVAPSPPFLGPIAPSGSGNSGGTGSPIAATSDGNGGAGNGAAAAVVVVTIIVVFGLVGLVLWCVTKRWRNSPGLGGHIMPTSTVSSPKSDSAILKACSMVPLVGSGSGSNSLRGQAGLGNSRGVFAFEELDRATNGFSDENHLGEGGFGSVYKGYLPDGREIAVKQLKIGGGQGEREFKAEVEIISRIHHRHLVSLVGYCISDTRRLLVYEFVPNNNLYNHLHGEGLPVMHWSLRFKVAAGAARGIAYLHEDCQPRVIHRDIKSSNILLDYNFEARVSDFGLAKLALDADTHISTRVVGTFGYMAPEYASSGKLTEKSDVYSFGVVILELITGRKPVDVSQPPGDESLVEWARPQLTHAIKSREYDNLVDPKLEKNYVDNEMFRMIEIAAACVRHSSAKRPRMGQVVRSFDSLGTSDLTNGMKVGESEQFNLDQGLLQGIAFRNQDFRSSFFRQGSSKSGESREKDV